MSDVMLTSSEAGTSAENPILVESYYGLESFSSSGSYTYYKLTKDITIPDTPASTLCFLSQYFYGELDGDGYSIICPSPLTVPIFHTIRGGVIKNLYIQVSSTAVSTGEIIYAPLAYFVTGGVTFSKVGIYGPNGNPLTFTYYDGGTFFSGFVGRVYSSASAVFNDCFSCIGMFFPNSTNNSRFSGFVAVPDGSVVASRCYFAGTVLNTAKKSSKYYFSFANSKYSNGVYALAGANNQTMYGTFYTQAQLQTQSTFANFDFDTTWQMSSTDSPFGGYPKFNFAKVVQEGRDVTASVKVIGTEIIKEVLSSLELTAIINDFSLAFDVARDKSLNYNYIMNNISTNVETFKEIQHVFEYAFSGIKTLAIPDLGKILTAYVSKFNTSIESDSLRALSVVLQAIVDSFATELSSIKDLNRALDCSLKSLETSVDLTKIASTGTTCCVKDIKTTIQYMSNLFKLIEIESEINKFMVGLLDDPSIRHEVKPGSTLEKMILGTMSDSLVSRQRSTTATFEAIKTDFAYKITTLNLQLVIRSYIKRLHMTATYLESRKIYRILKATFKNIATNVQLKYNIKKEVDTLCRLQALETNVLLEKIGLQVPISMVEKINTWVTAKGLTANDREITSSIKEFSTRTANTSIKASGMTAILEDLATNIGYGNSYFRYMLAVVDRFNTYINTIRPGLHIMIEIEERVPTMIYKERGFDLDYVERRVFIRTK